MINTYPRIDVAIIGAGFGGLGAALRLDQEGRGDFLVFERHDAVGGTWHVNTYPGAQCDIPSALYSFSFAPNPEWTRLYALQPEIEDYLQSCVENGGIADRIKLNHEVRLATWNEQSARWIVETSGGTWSARILIGALGPFSEPSTPDLPGLQSFEGAVFHSAQWDHSRDLVGKNVGVIGTGASAVQFLPRVAPDAAHLTLFQRTPTWILPHPDRRIHSTFARIFTLCPRTQRALRSMFSGVQAAFVPGLVRHPSLLFPAAVLGRIHLRRQVPDTTLRRKLTPTYRFGCKRPTYSNAFYPALCRDNVHVETNPIAMVHPNGIETSDGHQHELDTIILGTGFQVAGHSGFRRIVGRHGISLNDAWRDGEMTSYNGTSVHGFPNFFILLGPNSVVYTSQVVTIEAQVDYVLACLRAMDEQQAVSVDVRREIQARFTADVDRALQKSVWNAGGCSSYYLSPSGRNVTFWPGSVRNFERALADLDIADFEFGVVG
ncbi:flavin-containing monooxygenase [Rhodococcus sp. NBC_00297]|uniref:flavin-containing monooxygenase n=1 Tax=Rhodococcus sp. NBC_00297 TaxID=2976005 RepID=UPI002E2E1672|nr:NAD(P)/FAD-dependent oxidoreductase [Rhodococcus sp. NBC_00297]